MRAGKPLVVIALLSAIASLAYAQPSPQVSCPSGQVSFRACGTPTPQVATPTVTAPATPTLSTPATTTPTSRPPPSVGRTDTDCRQLGCDSGGTGFTDQIGGRLELAFKWDQTETNPTDELGTIEPIHLPNGDYTLLVSYGPVGGYDYPWRIVPHQTTFFMELRDPDTGRRFHSIGNVYSRTSRTEAWPALFNWTYYFTAAGRTYSRTVPRGLLFEQGRAGVGIRSKNNATLSLINRYDSERWAHLAANEELGKVCYVLHWTWHGGRPTGVRCEDLAGRSITNLISGGSWVADQPTDDIWPGHVVIDATTRAIVLNLQWALPAREEQRGIYTRSFSGLPQCFLPGVYSRPASRDGFSYALVNKYPEPLGRYVAEELVELDTRTCHYRRTRLPRQTRSRQAPIVAPDMLYLLLDTGPDAGAVVALDRTTLLPVWETDTDTTRVYETRAYTDPSDLTRMLAGHDQFYVATRTGLAVLDRHTGAVLQYVSDPDAPEGFAKLAAYGDKLAAVEFHPRLVYPRCAERLCPGQPAHGKINQQACCRLSHPKCEQNRPASACAWNEDWRYRIGRSFHGFVWKID